MKKDRKINLLIYGFTIVFLLSFQSSVLLGNDQQIEDTKSTLEEIDKLMEEKTPENCQQAIQGYEALLMDDPENPILLQKTAAAYTALIDIKTSAMIVEKKEFKPLLKKYGKIAYDYALKAYQSNPKNKEVVATCLVSYGYHSASFGIVKAVFKGAAGRYKDLAKQLNLLDDTYLGGLGYRLLGKLYLEAPWPVGSNKKALKQYLKAKEIDKTVINGRYYVGLLYFKQKKYNLAKEEFTYVLDNPPVDHEKHYIKEYIIQSQKYLDKISELKK